MMFVCLVTQLCINLRSSQKTVYNGIYYSQHPHSTSDGNSYNNNNDFSKRFTTFDALCLYPYHRKQGWFYYIYYRDSYLTSISFLPPVSILSTLGSVNYAIRCMIKKRHENTKIDVLFTVKQSQFKRDVYGCKWESVKMSFEKII